MLRCCASHALDRQGLVAGQLGHPEARPRLRQGPGAGKALHKQELPSTRQHATVPPAQPLGLAQGRHYEAELEELAEVQGRWCRRDAEGWTDDACSQRYRGVGGQAGTKDSGIQQRIASKCMHLMRSFDLQRSWVHWPRPTTHSHSAPDCRSEEEWGAWNTRHVPPEA